MSSSPHDRITTQLPAIDLAARRPAPRSACVVVIHGDGLGQRADIDARPIVVGRSDEADLHVPHKSVSRLHCEIRRDGETYLVRDLEATNRTRVNDLPVVESLLADGDHILVGESLLKFISHSSVEGRYHEEIYQRATHDALTELYNRRHFVELVDKEIARATRHGRPLVMCLLDVDLFKRINDRYGHVAGDQVLRRIGDLVRGMVRDEDIAARIGGEEFAVVLPESGLDAGRAFAERLREAVAATEFMLEDGPQCVTLSIGVAGLGPAGKDRTGLMQAADAALYRAKDQGRNRVCVEG